MTHPGLGEALRVGTVLVVTGKGQPECHGSTVVRLSYSGLGPALARYSGTRLGAHRPGTGPGPGPSAGGRNLKVATGIMMTPTDFRVTGTRGPSHPACSLWPTASGRRAPSQAAGAPGRGGGEDLGGPSYWKLGRCQCHCATGRADPRPRRPVTVTVPPEWPGVCGGWHCRTGTASATADSDSSGRARRPAGDDDRGLALARSQ